MKLWKNRTILLSIRERPLPVLWLLAWLAPYLVFNVASAPHFHPGEFKTAKVSQNATLQMAALCDGQVSELDSPSPDSEKPSPLHKASDCFLCEWHGAAHSEIAVSFSLPLTREAASPAPSSDAALSSSLTRTLRVRGPPSLS